MTARDTEASAEPSHRAWVEGATPKAPPALTARVAQVLGENPRWDALPVSEALVLAGEQLLAGVMATDKADARDRTTALDLLAADACVTWAFEVASAAPDALAQRARAVTAKIIASGSPQ